MLWRGENSWSCKRVSVGLMKRLVCLCHGGPGLEDSALGAAWLAGYLGVGARSLA